MTRLLGWAALALGVAGGLTGLLEAHSLVRISILHFYAYAIALGLLWAYALVVVSRALGDVIRRDPQAWHLTLLGSAPRWVTVVSFAGVAGSIAFCFYAVGGGVSISDGSLAPPDARGAIFVGFSPFGYLAFFALSAAARARLAV